MLQHAPVRISLRALLPLFLLSAYAYFPPGWAGMVVQACFTPEKQCSERILKDIQYAKREILVGVYAFTNEELAIALVRARRRGVEVKVVLDRKFNQESNHSKGSFLSENGVSVRQVSGLDQEEGKKGLMHQKFAVIDRSIVITGSYNWTLAADRFNHENVLFFRAAGGLAEEYRKEFFQLWEKAR